MFQHMQIEPAGAEIIFAVHFQPADAWAAIEELAVMRGAQSYACKRTHRR